MIKYAITSRTNNAVVKVIENGKLTNAELKEKYMVVFSDEVTPSMIRLEKSGIISYAQVDEGKSEIVEPPVSYTRRSRRAKVLEEATNNSDEVKEE